MHRSASRTHRGQLAIVAYVIVDAVSGCPRRRFRQRHRSARRLVVAAGTGEPKTRSRMTMQAPIGTARDVPAQQPNGHPERCFGEKEGISGVP